MNKIRTTKNTPMNTIGDTQLFYLDREKVVKPNFNQRLGLSKYAGWVAACVNINSNFIAAQNIKLYLNTKDKNVYKDVENRIKQGGTLQPGDILLDTFPVSLSQKRFLAGKEENKPSGIIYRTLKNWGSEYEEIVNNHPILDLITYATLYTLVVNLELTGNAYIYIIVDKDKKPIRLQVLSPAMVHAKVSKTGQVTSYEYGNSPKERKRLAKKNIIHFKYPSNNELEGIGPVQQCWDTLMLDEAVTEQRLGLFLNDCQPNILISLKNGANKDQIDRFNQSIFTQLLGPEKRGKFLTVGDDVSLTPMTILPKDIGNDEEGIIRRYAAIFGVPYSRLLGSNINRSTSETMDRGWLRGKISLILNLLTTSLNEGLIPFYTDSQELVLAFDNPIPSDKAFELNKTTALKNMGAITINEVRTQYDYEPIEGGDELSTNTDTEPIEDNNDENDTIEDLNSTIDDLRQEIERLKE